MNATAADVAKNKTAWKRFVFSVSHDDLTRFQNVADVAIPDRTLEHPGHGMATEDDPLKSQCAAPLLD